MTDKVTTNKDVERRRWATDLVRGRKWHPSQEFIELPGGGSRMRLRLNSIEEMEQWVLGWGTHATVLSPESLIRRTQGAAGELQKLYATTPPTAVVKSARQPCSPVSAGRTNRG